MKYIKFIKNLSRNMNENACKLCTQYKCAILDVVIFKKIYIAICKKYIKNRRVTLCKDIVYT